MQLHNIFQWKNLTTFIIWFLIFFILCLLVWLFIKPYYGYIISYFATKFVCLVRDFSIKEFALQEDNLIIQLTRPIITTKGVADLDVNLQTKISNFTFNMPLTLSLLFSMRFLIKYSKRIILEAICLLLIIHFLFMFLFVDIYLINITHKSGPEVMLEEYLWAFVDNLLIRFEPFLIVIYVLMRERILFAPTRQRES